MEELNKTMNTVRRVFLAYEPSYWRGLLCTLGSLSRSIEDYLVAEIMVQPCYLASLKRTLARIRWITSGKIEFNIIKITGAALRECKAFEYSGHFKPEICFRTYYFEFSNLSGNAAYIDIDTIVRKSLSQISSAIPENMPIAARAHLACHTSSSTDGSGSKKYFNSGVILFNNESFDNEIYERMSESRKLMADLSGRSVCLDQDALNIAFEHRWEELPVHFNYMTDDFQDRSASEGIILHATGSRKPWMLGSGHRFTREYIEEAEAIGLPPWNRYDAFWILRRLGKRSIQVIKKINGY